MELSPCEKDDLICSRLEQVPEEIRRRQIAKLAVDTEFRRELGENLMLLLEKLNDMRKPKMLAKIWKAFLEEKIDYPSFTRLARALEDLHVDDTPVLRIVYQGTQPANLPSLEFNPKVGLYEPPYRDRAGPVARLADSSAIIQVRLDGRSVRPRGKFS